MIRRACGVMRLLLVIAAVLVLELTPPAADAVATCWVPPVRGALLQPFDPPSCTYCAGSRGIVLAAVDDEPVQAVAAGTVTFAGKVAGTAYVVVEHADAVRITYGRLVTVAVRVGQTVSAGTTIGSASDELYVGLRDRDGEPLDPTPLLGHWRARPRLVPLDGAPRRPAVVTLRCPGGVVAAPGGAG
ncbi:unnamed protein product [Phaeothamnion confervicola]